MSPDQIAYRLRVGKWVRVWPRVYRAAAAPVTWPGSARAAALTVRGVVSHRSALRVWGVDGYPHRAVGPIDVVIDADRPGRRRLSGLRVHRSRHYDLLAATERDGIPVTGVGRSVLDVAAAVPLAELDRVIDAVIRQRLCSWEDLIAVLEAHQVRGRNGCGALRVALERRSFGDRVPDSRFNRLVGQVLVREGLPTPTYEYEVFDQDSFVGRVDLAYPGHRLAIECDSARFHRTSEAFVLDPRRKNRIWLAGWTVLSFTWADYRHTPRQMAATVAAALERTPVRSDAIDV